MTNEQILKQAIEKAVKNKPEFWMTKGLWAKYQESPKSVQEGFRENICFLIIKEDGEFAIYNHDFAKAFWGEKDYKYDGDESDFEDKHFQAGNPTGVDWCLYYVGKNWQYHLQQMVLEKEPLKYIEKFL